ncbi:putative zinc finger protein C09F5.3 [Toxorhynchites rutilus septentrionalis]|uniref:putative zinc finger protein C09F5.3 n=1 Tax=Toxorhynchites rutilus septentrionalis TaxID=329112 RepID=UPI002479CB4D|nr:putative zinc finger protein C09F5.3 [Toxorhynchites rutilus septentrionalis]
MKMAQSTKKFAYASANQKPVASTGSCGKQPKSSIKSIILEQNGEKRILKKVKLKGPLKVPPKIKPTQELNKIHKPEVAKDQLFTCIFCSGKFKSKKELETHILKHGTESQQSKKIEETTNLKQESAIMLIECEWCPETFISMSRAIEHKYRKHSHESKNYFCTLCGKLFPLKVALDQHQSLEHKNVKKAKVSSLDFTCEFCSIAFLSRDALELHVKTAHNLENRMMAHPFFPPPSKKVRLNRAGEIISIYYCHLCGCEYMLKFNLLKHIDMHHSYEERCAIPEDLLKCSTCDSVFYTKRAFDVHNVHHKPEDLYVTSEEHRLNIVARVDQDFDFRRVPTAMDNAMKTIEGVGSESATVLAKKHRAKGTKGKAAASASTTTRTSSGGDLGTNTPAGSISLNDLSATACVSSVGIEALQFLLGD